LGRLRAEQQERRREEWLADLHDVPGALGKLLWAVDCHRAATVINARAWKTKQMANSLIKEKLPTNGIGRISAKDLREVLVRLAKLEIRPADLEH
jgi:hypothetical protein